MMLRVFQGAEPSRPFSILTGVTLARVFSCRPAENICVALAVSGELTDEILTIIFPQD
jgi:hypothetical protein